ncbi:MAG: universal stress protein [Deltaproteobacteria bacterium]|nr:universal stress protein [Deltaproteobacteria bacterium]MBW2539202.1 universal stress protein [Deltaproteobacteria bacterium]
MEDIKKIMVALAFSEHAKDIFNYAVGLAKPAEAELVVVSIINSRDVQAVRKISAMGYDVDGEHYIEGIRKEREEILAQIIRASAFPSEKISTIFRVGNPVDELLKITVEKDIDLIVLGIKGHTDVEHFFIGSVAEKLFRRSPVPVISYRNKEQAERLRNRIHLS